MYLSVPPVVESGKYQHSALESFFPLTYFKSVVMMNDLGIESFVINDCPHIFGLVS